MSILDSLKEKTKEAIDNLEAKIKTGNKEAIKRFYDLDQQKEDLIEDAELSGRMARLFDDLLFDHPKLFEIFKNTYFRADQ